MLEEGFLDHVQRMSILIKKRIACLVDTYPDVLEDCRGQGLLIGMKCKVENLDLVDALRAEGLLAVGAGENVVRFIPPLNIQEEEVDIAMGALERACLRLSEAVLKN
jgi:acetylornithine/N-succinyldiaminopimelate aminotransferase